MDKLTLDMIECEKSGFGCHYGKWKAMQDKKDDGPKNLPEGWKICEWCGKWYKPKQQKSTQKYCEAFCQQQALNVRRREKAAEYQREYRAKMKEKKDDDLVL